MSQTTRRITHMCMNVRGAIQHHAKRKRHADSGANVDGRALSNAEFVEYLWDQAHQGRRVIPMAACCGNPCTNAARGCTGFDYTGGGCAGYSVPDDVSGRVGA